MKFPTILVSFVFYAFSNICLASCHEPIVLVHGNTATPSSWVNTKTILLEAGYTTDDIFTPDWGSKTCAACNNHNGSEETPVRNAILDAIASSCTGKIDIIGHSMGATLAAQQILKLNISEKVDTFIGIAGAFKGLRTCGVYPFNVWSSTCGYYGLSLYSPFIYSIANQNLGNKVYSIKSWFDQVVCATGNCYVGFHHSSEIDMQTGTFSFNEGHFGLQTNTAQFQYDLIQ